MKYLIPIFIFIFLTSFNILADKSCTVTKIIDGDTVHALCGTKETKIRLTTIDSYESKKNNRAYKQAYQEHITIDEVVAKGKRATLIANEELLGKQIKVVPPSKGSSIDMYKRDLGEIYIDGVNINRKMLKEHPDVFLKYK